MTSTRESGSLAVFEIVVIAVSLGGLQALSKLLFTMPADFPIPILIVQHMDARYKSFLVDILRRRTELRVEWALPGERLSAGTIYIAPPGQHILMDMHSIIALTQSPPVLFVRPSADLLFKSVANFYHERALAVVLTGYGSDGAQGALAIKQHGGRVLIQNRATSRAYSMPHATFLTGCVDYIVPLSDIARVLVILVTDPDAAALLDVATDESAD